MINKKNKNKNYYYPHTTPSPTLPRNNSLVSDPPSPPSTSSLSFSSSAPSSSGSSPPLVYIYIYIYSFLTHPSALLYFSIYSLSIFFFYISFDWLLGDEFWVWNDIDQLLFLFIYLYASNVSSCFISLVTVDQLLGILLSYQILLLLLLLLMEL